MEPSIIIKINAFENITICKQAISIRGALTIHGVTKKIEITIAADWSKKNISLTGDFNIGVADYNIGIPPAVKDNIAKSIKVSFNSEY